MNIEDDYVRIPVRHGHLEANLRRPEGEPVGAAVVCHPHPQHGGTMHTKAVFRTAQALNEAGLLALRFNFRGVGTSTGSYDEGRGEQEDVRAALDFLGDQAPELPLVVAGFSFGSMVGLRVTMEEPRVVTALGLGLPIRMYDFGFLRHIQRPLLVVQGERDQFGGGWDVVEAVAPLSPWIQVETVGEADHFFDQRFEEMKGRIRGFFLTGEGAKALSEPRAGVGES